MTWGGVLLGVAVGLLVSVASLLVATLLLVKLPATYFQDPPARPTRADRHSLRRLAARAGKNILGAILVAVGAVLALPGVPGQGVLTIVVGLVLLDVPGKRRLERRLVGRPRVLRAINALRQRFGSAPLVLDSGPEADRRSRPSPATGRAAGGNPVA
jgi:hypothetical protein